MPNKYNNNNNGLRKIEDYVLIRLVGHGDFGTVYEALKDEATKSCVLKEASLSYSSKRDVNDVMKETFLSRALTHPNVVSYDNIFLHHLSVRDNIYNCLCLEMPFFEEGNYADLLYSNIIITPEDVAFYTLQILNGLHYLHSSNIIHRELKPENLLMSKNKRHITITDFGLSFLSSGASCKTCVDIKPCMAPEVIRNIFERCDFSADIWSLGCIMCETIARGDRRREPFSSILMYLGATRFQVHIKELLVNAGGGFSEALMDFCLSLLRLNGNDRPTAAVAFQQLKAISNSTSSDHIQLWMSESDVIAQLKNELKQKDAELVAKSAEIARQDALLNAKNVAEHLEEQKRD